MWPMARCAVSIKHVYDSGDTSDDVPDAASTNHRGLTPRGPELARAAAEAARRKQGSREFRRADRSSGEKGARGQGTKEQRNTRSRLGGYTGTHADPRDPQLLSAEIKRLFNERGWQQAVTQARIFGAWDQLVGADLAAKCTPVSLRDGELVIAATSTAWATQLRMLTARILTGIRRELHSSGVIVDLVRVIRVHGPVGPTWKHGLRSVPGRGPRDTYG